MTNLTTHQIEARLLESLAKDRSQRSRSTFTTNQAGTTATVTVSNTTYGLAIAVGARTGESDPMAVINRVVS